MSKIKYVQVLRDLAIRFKKDGNLVELMRIQSELASIATGFRVLGKGVSVDGFDKDEVEVSEHALDALRSIEREDYHAGVLTLQDPTDMGQSLIEVLHKQIIYKDDPY